MDSISNLETVDTIANHFDTFMQQACNREFKIHDCSLSNKHKGRRLKWWDTECATERAAAIKAGERIESDNDKLILKESCKTYRSCKQRKTRQLKYNNVNRLNQAYGKNKSNVWQTIKEISGNDTTFEPDREDLFNHFDELSKPSYDKTFSAEYLDKAQNFLDKYENDNDCKRNFEHNRTIQLDILNKNIDKAEVNNAINMLKKKALAQIICRYDIDPTRNTSRLRFIKQSVEHHDLKCIKSTLL